MRKIKHSRSQCLGDRALIRAVASSQDLRGRVLVEEIVDNVQESLELSILVVVSDGDEGDRNVSSKTDRVLNIEVLEAGRHGMSVLEGIRSSATI